MASRTLTIELTGCSDADELRAATGLEWAESDKGHRVIVGPHYVFTAYLPHMSTWSSHVMGERVDAPRHDYPTEAHAAADVIARVRRYLSEAAEALGMEVVPRGQHAEAMRMANAAHAKIRELEARLVAVAVNALGPVELNRALEIAAHEVAPDEQVETIERWLTAARVEIQAEADTAHEEAIERSADRERDERCDRWDREDDERRAGGGR